MTKKKESGKSEKDKPVETVEPTPTVKGAKVVGLLEKFRSRAKDDKLKAKADEVHKILMGVKPGPITVKPSGGWVSYLSEKVRFAALEVGASTIKIHSLELDNKKMTCEIIKISAEDEIPVAKITNRAEAYITDKTK